LKIQKKLDAMTDWQKLWSTKDETYVDQLALIDRRIAAVENAQTLKEVEAAKLGADFVTSGPRLLMVGDNPGGRERVSIEPLSSPNINGPGAGVTFVIQGNTFVGAGGVDELVGMIEARRRTLTFRGRLPA